MSNSTWKEVTRGTPCPVCGHDTWCAVTRDGRCCLCRRFEEGPLGPGKAKTDKDGVDYWIHWLDSATSAAGRDPEPLLAPTAPGAPRADADTLHRAYSKLLDGLSLTEEHRQNLQDRGLSDADIDGRGYRTLPMKGRRKVAQDLVRVLGEVDAPRIPGLYVKEQENRRSWNLAGSPGLVIPVRDEQGRIRALRIRADRTDDDAPKYTWLSSAGDRKGNGPSPGSLVHVPLIPGRTWRTPAFQTNEPAEKAPAVDGGPGRNARQSNQPDVDFAPAGAPGDVDSAPAPWSIEADVDFAPAADCGDVANACPAATTQENPAPAAGGPGRSSGQGDVENSCPAVVRLTEGELKADVASVLSGILTVAIPGVGCWRKALPVLEALGAEVVHLAFDADARTNKQVARNLRNAARGLAEANLEVRLEVWSEEDGKGIDDLLAAGKQPAVLSGDDIWSEVQDIASAAGVPAPAEEEAREAIRRLRAGDHTVAFLPNVLHAAGVLYTADPGLYAELKMAVGNAGVPRPDWERAVKPHRQDGGGGGGSGRHLRAVQPGEGRPGQRKSRSILQVLPDAPVDQDLVIPSGWELRPHQLCRVTSTENGDSRVTAVAPAPVLLTGRLHDITEGTEAAQVTWFRDGSWRRHTADRQVLAKNRAIVDLAGFGLPVTDRNASDLVDYLAEFEAANLPALPKANVSRQMGWQDGGRLGFLVGRTLLRPDGEMLEAANLEVLDPRHWDRSWVAFRGADLGEEQLADGFHQAGSFETWRSEVATIAACYPRVGLALYAALAPPLLEVLAARNFIVDWSFSTSTGKTTALRVAASCWGCPDERAPASVVGSWDATRTWIESACSVLRGLPLILDDTKRAKNPQGVGQVLYDVAMGRGRGRGSVRGTRRTATWQTVLLSSGEAPATTFTRDGGTVARCLTVWGPPFQRADETSAPIVHRLDLGTLAHYGHAGPRVVQFLLQARDRWPEWRARHHDLAKRYLDRAGSNEVACRLASHFATLHAAARVAHSALELPWNPVAILDPIWDDVLREVGEGDRTEQALQFFLSWASSNAVRFYGRHLVGPGGEDKPPQHGWAGRWEKRDWEFLGVFPHVLREVLERGQFDVEAILRSWKDRGWLLCDHQGKATRSIRVDGDKARLVCLTRDAVDRTHGPDVDRPAGIPGVPHGIPGASRAQQRIEDTNLPEAGDLL